MNGVLLLLPIAAYLIYRLGCWVHDLGERATEREIRRQP